MRSAKLRSLLAMVALAAVVLPMTSPTGATEPRPPAAQAPQQGPAGIPGQQPPLRLQVQLVDLFVTVRDKHKAIVPNLTKDDFRVLENGQEQKIDYFARESSLPITLCLLIDTSGSEGRTLPAEQEAASRFLRRVLGKKDMALVISFDTDADLLSDFTEDQAQLERAIARARINAPQSPPMVQGPVPISNPKGTVLYDAIYLACREKLAGEAGRKALVILTDAVDQGSDLKLEDAVEAAQRADAVIHIIYIADPNYYAVQGFGEGVARKMAEETGGRMIDASSEKRLEKAFGEISEELRSQYVLGYYPANAARDGTFRKVKVETTRPGLHVLTRKGYYSPKN